jgi:tetratricopeptide (TPR) repeat protein
VKRLLAEPRLVALLLFLVTAALFWPATQFDFLNYDDDTYVTANTMVRAGLTGESMRAAFTSGAAANWHPLTWLSHQLDVELFALDAGSHHRTSVLLHALNAALVFLAVRALTRQDGPSALVAALFAWHPLRVESVAWVAERKDVLAGTFFAATLWAHARWVRTRRRGAYAATLAFLALGLLAKPMLVTLPAVLFVLDLWPLERTDRVRAALEKLPHLALALASCVVTLLVQVGGGALDELSGVGFGARLLVAVQSLGQYVLKSFAPSALAPLHPHPALEESAGLPGPLAATLLLLVVSALVIGLRRRAPGVLAGWLLFLGMLVPVLGLVPVGLASWAERYTYLPSIGLFLALVFGAARLLPDRVQAMAAGAGALALAGSAWTTRAALAPWHDSESLFAHAVDVEPSSVAHAQLARALEAQGRLEEALEHDEAAIARRPTILGLHANRARLAWLLVQAPGDDALGVEHLRRAHAATPDDEELANMLAWVLATSPSAAAPEEARALAEGLIARNPRQLAYQETLAAALARLGNFAEAARLQAALVERLPASAQAAPRERLALFQAGKAFIAAP